MEPVPFWFMRQAGRYLPEYQRIRRQAGSFLDLVYNPDLAAEVTLQPVRRFGMDAAILFSDILVIPDALGQNVRFEEGRGPVLQRLRGPEDIDGLERARVREQLAPVFETLRQVRQDLPAETALIGFAGAPWTVATYMVEGGSSRDHALTKRWALGEPESFARLMDILVEATIDYLLAQVEAGAEVLQLFDSWAGSLGGSDLARWVFEPTRRIVDGLKEGAPDTPLIGFPRGIGHEIERFCTETGVAAVSLGNDIEPAWAAENLPTNVVIQGNLDPRLLLAGEKDMIDEAKRILVTLADRPHIFNLGHGITPDVEPERIDVLSNFLRTWTSGRAA